MIRDTWHLLSEPAGIIPRPNVGDGVMAGHAENLQVGEIVVFPVPVPVVDMQMPPLRAGAADLAARFLVRQGDLPPRIPAEGVPAVDVSGGVFSPLSEHRVARAGNVCMVCGNLRSDLFPADGIIDAVPIPRSARRRAEPPPSPADLTPVRHEDRTALQACPLDFSRPPHGTLPPPKKKTAPKGRPG